MYRRTSLSKEESSSCQPTSRGAVSWLAVLLGFSSLIAGAQTQPSVHSRYDSRRNSFGVFVAYADDSSHILLGDADQRKLLEFGVSYTRRLLLGRIVNWQCSAEFLPVALESDPLTRAVISETSPVQGTVVLNGESAAVICHPLPCAFNFTDGDVTYAGIETLTCHGGYKYSTRKIPVDTAGSFNFTLDIGAGLELYRTPTRSLRLEYRYHHISNDETATSNPGIDNGLLQVTYSFGR